MACALAECREYIFGPDMGTDEQCMAWVRDEVGRAMGLPRELGGIPLDELGATGFGVAHATEVAAELAGLEFQDASFAVQGFGAVGQHAARFLEERGAMLVAASDSQGGIYDPSGLDVQRLRAFKAQGRSVAEYDKGTRIDVDALVDVPCDVWIPAARPDVLTEENCGRLRARVVVSGANIPITPGAQTLLHERGVLCVPDFIANAGGVICAATEYRGASERDAFASIEEKIRANTRAVLEAARRDGITPGEAAVELARERVGKAMQLRRWSVF
jgi:glutamate dehydrogenase (NAD(P)+)